MASGLFNIAKGRTVEFYNNVESNSPANSAFIVVLLKTSVADDSLIDFDNLSLALADAGVDEADFTNYARKTVTDTELDALPAPDDGANTRTLDFPDQTWTSAGGASNNTLVKFLICYDSDTTSGDDTNIIPVGHYDFNETTDGNDLIATINSAGFYRAN